MPTEDITELLRAHREGDEDAFERLVPLVYDDLRRVAHFQLRRQRPGATLNTTPRTLAMGARSSSNGMT